MDDLIHELADDAGCRALLQMALSEGLLRAGLFILVAARLSGLLLVGPLLGRTILTWPIRLGLIVLLSLIVTPTLPMKSETTNDLQVVSHSDPQSVSARRSSNPSLLEASGSPADFALSVLCEAIAGAAIGVGVAVLLAGLKLGGEWLDRHSGLGMGSVLNPEFASEGSAPAEMLWLFGIAVVLLMQPSGGHLLFVRTVLESFRAMPVGGSGLPSALIELPGQIVQQSLLLGLRVALPFVVVMSMLDMTLSFANRSLRWTLVPTVYALRIGAGLLILAATWPGIAEAVTTSVIETLQTCSDGLSAESRLN